MKKKLYFNLNNGEGEGGIMKLSGVVAWIKGDMEANYPGEDGTPEDELPEYTLSPVWLTDKEYEALPNQ